MFLISTPHAKMLIDTNYNELLPKNIWLKNYKSGRKFYIDN